MSVWDTPPRRDSGPGSDFERELDILLGGQTARDMSKLRQWLLTSMMGALIAVGGWAWHDTRATIMQHADDATALKVELARVKEKAEHSERQLNRIEEKIDALVERQVPRPRRRTVDDDSDR